MTQVTFRNVAAPLPLLVWVVSCLAAASVSAQQRAAFGGSVSVSQPLASAPDVASAPVVSPGPGRGAVEWLTRLRQASHAPAFVGTYVVWSAPGTLASSRIWHASRGDLEVERVDALSGEPRSTYRAVGRRGNAVETFLFPQHLVRIDHRDEPGGGGFPNLPGAGQGVSAAADYYDARQTGQERVAGFMADVVQFAPRDGWRYGYRVWSDQRTGLALKLQTLDTRGRVLEQAAFSGLTFDAQANVESLLREMHHRHGWRVERVSRSATTAMAEGWQIGGADGQPAPGFALQHCYRQPVPVVEVSAGNVPADSLASDDSAAQTRQPDQSGRTAAGATHWFQCVFSDGLAAVSVFIEPYDAAQHVGDHGGAQEAALGATHLLARRVGGMGWVTVMGEVPLRTLDRFIAQVSPLP